MAKNPMTAAIKANDMIVMAGIYALTISVTRSASFSIAEAFSASGEMSAIAVPTRNQLPEWRRTRHTRLVPPLRVYAHRWFPTHPTRFEVPA
jgi:hypothetical protein